MEMIKAELGAMPQVLKDIMIEYASESKALPRLRAAIAGKSFITEDHLDARIRLRDGKCEFVFSAPKRGMRQLITDRAATLLCERPTVEAVQQRALEKFRCRIDRIALGAPSAFPGLVLACGDASSDSSEAILTYALFNEALNSHKVHDVLASVAERQAILDGDVTKFMAACAMSSDQFDIVGNVASLKGALEHRQVRVALVEAFQSMPAQPFTVSERARRRFSDE